MCELVTRLYNFIKLNVTVYDTNLLSIHKKKIKRDPFRFCKHAALLAATRENLNHSRMRQSHGATYDRVLVTKTDSDPRS